MQMRIVDVFDFRDRETTPPLYSFQHLDEHGRWRDHGRQASPVQEEVATAAREYAEEHKTVTQVIEFSYEDPALTNWTMPVRL